MGRSCKERVYLMIDFSCGLRVDCRLGLDRSSVLRMVLREVLMRVCYSVYEKVSNNLINLRTYCLLMSWKEEKF